MLLSISTTHVPATDLGYLLGKNPARVQTFELSYGHAHVFYSEATDARCTAHLLLDVDPVGLARTARRAGNEGLLSHYVNDRPYVASSLMSVAISQLFGSIMNGRSREREELAQQAIPLRCEVSVVCARGGDQAIRRYFEPLGYAVETTSVEYDSSSEWGDSPYFHVALTATVRLSELMQHLYVLLPALDGSKHYWVGDDEIEKLVDKGGTWLAAHPAREAIVSRYLKRRTHLIREAIARLTVDEAADVDEVVEQAEASELAIERRANLNDVRLDAVVSTLAGLEVARVADVGCGEGKLLARLLKDRRLESILGLDVSTRTLEIAHDRLGLDRMSPRQRARIELVQGSVTYRDARLAGLDAVCAVEVIEHLEPSRLDAFARVIFEHARPAHVVVTTPNAEYNVRFESLAHGAMRHTDHRFEWTRSEFEQWCASVASRAGYTVRFEAIGPIDPKLGAPTQMGVFSR